MCIPYVLGFNGKALLSKMFSRASSLQPLLAGAVDLDALGTLTNILQLFQIKWADIYLSLFDPLKKYQRQFRHLWHI